MPTVAELLTTAPRGQAVHAYVAPLTDETTVAPDVNVVNATGRTPAAGQTAVVLQIGSVHVLVGFYG